MLYILMVLIEMSLLVSYDVFLMALLVPWLLLLLTAYLSHFRGHGMAQLVEALRYKPKGRRFDS